MKTARLSLLISAEDKADIVARATALELSSSELIRRAVSAYEPERDDGEIQALASELLSTVQETEQALDATLERLDSLDQRLEDARREARAAALSRGETWPFPLPRAHA